MRRAPIAAVIAAALALPGCVGLTDLDEAIEREQRYESVIAEIEAIPEALRTPQEAADLAEALEAEVEAERFRKALEKLQTPELVDAGKRAAEDAIGGRWLGLIEGLLIVAGAALTAYTGRTWANLNGEIRLAEMEARRDASRATVGLPPAKVDEQG